MKCSAWFTDTLHSKAKRMMGLTDKYPDKRDKKSVQSLAMMLSF